MELQSFIQNSIYNLGAAYRRPQKVPDFFFDLLGVSNEFQSEVLKFSKKGSYKRDSSLKKSRRVVYTEEIIE